MKTRLYIDGRMADLSEDSFILFNYTMDEAQNPAIVKNSFTQEITLPGTPANNEIFGRFYRLDRKTEDGFNPLRKTPFVIYNEMNEVLEEGYVKLNKVSTGREGSTYSITLFGGLGGFFYNLMYNEDGTKKSLADIYFYNEEEGRLIEPRTEQMTINRNVVASAWEKLEDPDDEGFFSIINFAPAYNGIPTNHFDANRAVFKQGVQNSLIPNLYTSQVADGHTYTTRSDANGYALLELENKHTEWEMQDLRSYMQRPVVRVREILRALCLTENTGEYHMFLDDEFFDATNNWYWNGWMTLPMIDRSKFNPYQFSMGDLLKGTDSPADYLIGFAKMFGLSFILNPTDKTILLSGRNYFFVDNTLVDLSKRIDPSVEINPHTMDSKFYLWKSEMFGEYASEYAKKFGKTYGEERVNTGYDFNAEAVNVLDGVVYKGAPEVIESNARFCVFDAQTDTEYGTTTNYYFKMPFFENVKWKLYYTETGGKVQSKDFEPIDVDIRYSPTHYSLDNTFKDFMSKVQLHGAEDKSEAGNNVLLFYNGKVETPEYRVGSLVISQILFHLSDDTDEMLALNGGKPCYDVSMQGSNILGVFSLPQFTRFHTNEAHDEIDDSWEFGAPLEVATDLTPIFDGCIYHNFWRRYIADKFNVDTQVVNVKVNLSGFRVNAELLRRFYWFDNSVWVLNKIINHSLNTDDLTECEFIKVQDEVNYYAGQIQFT